MISSTSCLVHDPVSEANVVIKAKSVPQVPGNKGDEDGHVRSDEGFAPR